MGKEKDAKKSNAPQFISRVLHPSTFLKDAVLYVADMAGVPSQYTNAVRDINSNLVNKTGAAIEGIYNMATGKAENFQEGYKQADTNPSPVAGALFRYYPLTNTDKNYSQGELEEINKLDRASGGKPGQITARGYKRLNNTNHYALNSNEDNRNRNTVEWSIGQTSGIKDPNTGERYLSDVFAFDEADNPTYQKKVQKSIENGELPQPMVLMRYGMGMLGSRGYEDGSNSATSIKTKIPVSAYRKIGGSLNYLNYVEQTF